MKISAVSSAVPNMREVPKVSVSSVNANKPSANTSTLPQNAQSAITNTPQNIPASPLGKPSVGGLTGLENTEGNFINSYVAPNEEILAEIAFAQDIYKKNKRKFQKMLASPALQLYMNEGSENPEDVELLLKP